MFTFINLKGREREIERDPSVASLPQVPAVAKVGPGRNLGVAAGSSQFFLLGGRVPSATV